MPLYDEADAHRALGHFHPVGFHREIEVAEGVTVEFVGSGHLLGSAYIVARLSGGTTILFGGDLGRYARPVLPDPESASDVRADIVLCESTYGDREHPTDDQGDGLAAVIHSWCVVARVRAWPSLPPPPHYECSCRRPFRSGGTLPSDAGPSGQLTTTVAGQHHPRRMNRPTRVGYQWSRACD